ncbi:MAG: cation diffusion facilitator family transporter [Oscillospiraceae bacterium]|nr:cation diffusion facilitator family transporter [Oscillospiraceae bacterium]
MLNSLLRRFVPNYENTEDKTVRQRCGVFSGVVGIILNLLLFAGKLTAGLIAGAISVTADAFNNLSDAASSVVTLVGFRLAGQEADADHPFGHGRMEYLAGLAVSLLILLVGVELGKSSIEKIIHPEETLLSPLTAGILVVSVLVKLWMAWFNSAMGKRIRSEALRATAADSRSDAIATSAVLVGLLLSRVFRLPLDGWVGVLVAILIIRTGFGSAKATLDPLLGQPPEPEEVHAIEQLILSFPPISGIHDLVVHDYGPGRRMMSVHAEVPADCDIMEVHDVIDHVERELGRTFSLEAVIHMDPIQSDNPLVQSLREMTADLARQVDPAITIHDFRITDGPNFTNLIFDVVVPYSVKLSDGEVKERLARMLGDMDERYHAVIQVDRSYVR